MGRTKQTQIVFIDTHIALWLAENNQSKFSQIEIATLEDSYKENRLYIPIIVKLELEYLFEVGKSTMNAGKVLSRLERKAGIKTHHSSYLDVINEANKIKWTRDVFDRLIVAESITYDALLITRDKKICQNYTGVLR
jgi:PIN domain nuclease of toxin-antitoxin system